MTSTVTPEGFRERTEEVEGWPVGIVSYRIGERWHCKIHNVSPGAVIERGSGDTREAAEDDALGRARPRLAATRRMKSAIAELRNTVNELDSTLRDKS